MYARSPPDGALEHMLTWNDAAVPRPCRLDVPSQGHRHDIGGLTAPSRSRSSTSSTCASRCCKDRLRDAGRRSRTPWTCGRGVERPQEAGHHALSIVAAGRLVVDPNGPFSCALDSGLLRAVTCSLARDSTVARVLFADAHGCRHGGRSHV